MESLDSIILGSKAINSSAVSYWLLFQNYSKLLELKHMLSNIIYRALEMENKLLRLEFNLPDHPGTMEKIVNAISSSGANIYHAEVDNLNKDTPIGYQYLLFTINVLDKSRIDELLGRLDKLGYKYRIIG